MRPLDHIDRQILRELQDDGRITNVELARRIGISAPPCLRRVRSLEQAGYITDYRARLNAKALGFDVTAFAMVQLSSQSETDLQAFEAFARRAPLVRECWMLSGQIDFILKCVAPNLSDVSGLRHRPDGRTARPQCQDFARSAQWKGCSVGAHRAVRAAPRPSGPFRPGQCYRRGLMRPNVSSYRHSTLTTS